MTETNHEKRIKKTEAEIVEIKKQIMQLEFTSKRDHFEARKEITEIDRSIRKHLRYLSKLTGIAFDELNLLDEKVQESGRTLARPRKHSTLS